MKKFVLPSVFLVLLLGYFGFRVQQGCLGPVPVLVGAYYYPWYNEAKWREPISHTPDAGKYMSVDKDTVARHVKQAKQAGLSFFILSWIPQQNHELLPVLDMLDHENFQYIVLYESSMALTNGKAGPIRFDENMETTPVKNRGAVFEEHMEFFYNELASRKNYFKIAGDPAIIFYVARDYYSANPYLEKTFHSMEAKHKKIFTIADVVYWDPPEKINPRLSLTAFSAVTAYNMYAGNYTEEMKDYLSHVHEHYSKFEKFVEKKGGMLIPNVQPGYDDRALRGKERPTVERGDGAFYRAFFKLGMDHLNPKANVIFLTSFNEWFEGTEIETSKEFGERYLNLTKELIDKHQWDWMSNFKGLKHKTIECLNPK